MSDIMEFLDQGDAAPSGRYNYRYTTLAAQAKIPDVLTEDTLRILYRSLH